MKRLVFAIFLVSLEAYSATGLTLQGRITRDSKAIKSSSVSFLVQIRSPGSENCLLYQETHTVNMSSSMGLFSLPIGSGTRSASSVDGGYSLQRIFSNRGTIDLSSVVVNSANTQPCASGTSYTPAANDKRKIVYSFNDGKGSVALSPIEVSYSPMSLYALDSEAVGGFGSGNLLRVVDGSGNPAGGSAPSSALTTANMTELMNLITGASVQYIKPGSAAFTAQPTFAGVPVNASDLVNKAYVDAAASAGLPNTGTAGTYTKVTTDAQGRVTSGTTLVAGDIPNLDAAKITTGTLTVPVNTTGSVTAGSVSTSGNITASATVTANTISGNALRAYDSGTGNYVALTAPAGLAGNVTFKLPGVDGTSGQVLKTDGSGNLAWISPSTGSVTSVTGTAPIVSSGGSTPAISLSTGNGLTVSSNNLVVDSGLGANKIPQVGGTLLSANGVIVANGTGTALASLNCTLNQVIKFDASGFATCGTDGGLTGNEIMNGGNSTGAAVSIGTNDNYDLNFETNNTTNMTIKSDGNVGIGTTSPNAPLNVNKNQTSASMSNFTGLSVNFTGSPPTSNWSSYTGAYISSLTNNNSGITTDSTYGIRVSSSSSGTGTSSRVVGGDFTILNLDTTNSEVIGLNAVSTVLNGAVADGFGGKSRFYFEGGSMTKAFGQYNSVTTALFGVPGTVGTAYGTYSKIDSIGNKTITTGYGLYSEVLRPSGTITTGYGVYVGNVQASTKYSVYVSDPAAPSYFAGNVGIGTTSPTAKLEVQGAAVSKTNTIAAGATVNLALSNVHYLKAVGGAIITLQNPVSGGSYTLVVSDLTSRTYTFSGCTNTYFNPANGATSGRSTYSILTIEDGSNIECYIAWMTGFN